MLTENRRLLRLVSILYAHLEKKASLAGLISFKQMANREFGELSTLICRLFPTLDGEQALKFLQLQLAAAIGLYTMTDLWDTQRQVLEKPEFQHFQIDFKASLREAIGHLLEGMLKQGVK